VLSTIQRRWKNPSRKGSRISLRLQPSIEVVEERIVLSSLSASPGAAATAATVSTPVSAQTGDTASFDAATDTIDFTLTQPAVVTVGVFNAQGQLIRTVYSMQSMAAGPHVAQWDGKDNAGNVAPAGNYSVEIAINRDTYTNVGAIGQSASNPSTADHVPVGMPSVAVDSAGAIYTADSWDEPGADFKKWGPDGSSIYDDGAQVRNSTPSGLPYRIATDGSYVYMSVVGQNQDGTASPQVIERYAVGSSSTTPAPFTGSGTVNGNIQVYDNLPGVSEYTPSSQLPLQSLALSGNTLYVADAHGNRVLSYDKTTGALLGQFSVTAPEALAVDSAGRLWVGHQQGTVSVYSPSGTLQANAITGLGDVVAMAFGPNGNLSVADSGAGQVKIYQVSGLQTQLVQTIGQPAQPGDADPAHFYNLTGMAVDSSGNVITTQSDPISGAALTKFAPNGSVLWSQFSNEFVSLGNYGQDNPSQFYSMSFHQYDLTSPSTGSWRYVADTYPGGTNYASGPAGVPRVLSIGGSDFYFEPTGDGMQVYRIEGSVFHLAALVGGNDPAPDASERTEPPGKWSWSDTSGSGVATPSAVTWYALQGTPNGNYHTAGMNVDAQGNLWFADAITGGIWEVPLGSLNAQGDPTYNWASAREVIPKDTSSFGFQPQKVQHAADGSIYAFGWSTAAPPDGTPLWMGGTTLVKYNAAGVLQWSVQLPEVCTGMDVIPGGAGGVILGGGKSATLYQYTSNGLLIGSVSPGAAMANTSSWLDDSASVAVNRNPQDGELDIFTEDDYGLHIGWYRVDDQALTTLNLTVPAPSNLPTIPTGLSATVSTAGQATISWTTLPDVASYEVDRSVAGSGQWTEIEQVNGPAPGAPLEVSMTDSGLAPGMSYAYRVRALGGSTPEAFSAVVPVAVPSTAPPTTLASDAFDGTSLAPAWQTKGGTWVESNGVLSQTSTAWVDPQKVVLNDSFPSTDLEITAKVEVDTLSSIDYGQARAGVGLDTGTNGQGYNLLFHGKNQVQFLDDQVGWSSPYTFDWSVGQWYWFTLEEQGGTLYGKIWADGTPEPSNWMFVRTGWNDRTGGSPSLNGGSGNTTVSFDNVTVNLAGATIPLVPLVTTQAPPTTTPVVTPTPVSTPPASITTPSPSPTSSPTTTSQPVAASQPVPTATPTPTSSPTVTGTMSRKQAKAAAAAAAKRERAASAKSSAALHATTTQVKTAPVQHTAPTRVQMPSYPHAVPSHPHVVALGYANRITTSHFGRLAPKQ
jgi:hypothetical protein